MIEPNLHPLEASDGHLAGDVETLDGLSLDDDFRGGGVGRGWGKFGGWLGIGEGWSPCTKGEFDGTDGNFIADGQGPSGGEALAIDPSSSGAVDVFDAAGFAVPSKGGVLSGNFQLTEEEIAFGRATRDPAALVKRKIFRWEAVDNC